VIRTAPEYPDQPGHLGSQACQATLPPVAAGAAALSITLAACGGGNSTSSSSTTSAAPTSSTASAPVDATHNAADVSFAQNMIVHHQGAIEMAKTEQANGSNPQAKALAHSIETSQTAEVTEMAQRLKNL
jgi:uncharacterized protein (DUF305 family)